MFGRSSLFPQEKKREEIGKAYIRKRAEVKTGNALLIQEGSHKYG